MFVVLELEPWFPWQFRAQMTCKIRCVGKIKHPNVFVIRLKLSRCRASTCFPGAETLIGLQFFICVNCLPLYYADLCRGKFWSQTIGVWKCPIACSFWLLSCFVARIELCTAYALLCVSFVTGNCLIICIHSKCRFPCICSVTDFCWNEELTIVI